MSNAYDLDADDLLEIFSIIQPSRGSVVLKNRKMYYTPQHGFIGDDSFSCWIADYQVVNGEVVYSGGLAEAEITVNVVPGGGVFPTARITKPVQADYSAGGVAANYPRISEGILRVEGTASHPDESEPVNYHLVIYDMNDNEVYRHSVVGPVENGVLDNIDLSGLRNGIYDLWLIVEGGNEFAEDSARFILESDLKVGQFTFSEEDAIIPTRGMPLTVFRTYDSLNPNQGDFGYSWSFAINSMDVELDEFREDILDILEHPSTAYFSMRVGGGRNVTVTLPDGRRSTFLFTMVKDPDAFLFGMVWWPRFVSPQGVNARLEVSGSHSLNMLPSGIIPPYWQGGDPRLPETGYDFPGFILTTEDGTRYILSRDPMGQHTVVPQPGDGEEYGKFNTFEVTTYGPPKLTRIEHPDGSTTHISDDKVWEEDSGGNDIRALYFERANGRITEIYDPASMEYYSDEGKQKLRPKTGELPLVKYNYDTHGRLSFVQKLADRTATAEEDRYQTTSSYGYHPDFPNYITEVRDGRGVPLTRNEYYPEGHRDQGRLMSVKAPDGTKTVFERVYPTDEEGVENSEFTDLNHGDANVVAIEKVIVHPVFDGFTDPDSGIVTTHCTDAKGNVLYTTDHVGNTTRREYDSHNNVTSETRMVVGTGQDIVTSTERTYKVVQGKETDEVIEEITTAPRNASGMEIKSKVIYEDWMPKISIDGNNFDKIGEEVFFYTENVYDSETRQLTETYGKWSDEREPVLLSKSVYYPETGVDDPETPFKGLLKYTEDAKGSRSFNEYYNGVESGGRFGDQKRAYVQNADEEILSDTYYEYDSNGNRTKESKRRDLSDTAPGSIVTLYRYDDRGRLDETEDAEGGVSKTFYNPFAKVEYTEDRYGNETRYTYGANGDVIKTTYPDGSIVRTVSRYIRTDVEGVVKRWKEVIREEPHFPSGHPRYNSAEPVHGSRSISDEIGRQIRSERLTSLNISWDEVLPVTLPRNTGIQIYKTTFQSAALRSWTETKYNDAGQVESTEQGYVDVSHSIPSTSTSYYDGNGRRYRVQTHLENGAGTTDDEYTQTYYVFDANNNQTHFCTIEGETTTALALSDGRWTRYEYDDFNRRTKTYFPFLTGHTEATRYFTETRYDILGQRIEEM